MSASARAERSAGDGAALATGDGAGDDGGDAGDGGAGVMPRAGPEMAQSSRPARYAWRARQGRVRQPCADLVGVGRRGDVWYDECGLLHVNSCP